MKKSYHKNGVTVSEFDNKAAFDFKKVSGGKAPGKYTADAPLVAPGAAVKKVRSSKRKKRIPLPKLKKV